MSTSNRPEFLRAGLQWMRTAWGQDGMQSNIFFAEAEQVGYKRTTRHPAGIPQPNDLFTAEDAGHIVIDIKNPTTIFDALRKAHVFSG